MQKIVHQKKWIFVGMWGCEGECGGVGRMWDVRGNVGV